MPTIRFTVIWSYFTGEFTYRLSFSCGPSVWPVQPQNEFRFANGNQQKGLTLFLQQGASWFLSSVLNSRINGGWIFCWLTFNSHWGRVMHISINNLTIIGSDNSLSPGWCQPIISLNAGILLIQTLGTSVSEILNEIHTFSFKKMLLQMLSAKGRPFCLVLDVLNSCKLLKAWWGVCQHCGCWCPGAEVASKIFTQCLAFKCSFKKMIN